MKLEIINGSLCVTEKDIKIFEDLYVGVRYFGNLYNTLESYKEQKFTVVPTKLPEKFKSGQAYLARATDADIIAVFSSGKMYFKTEYRNEDTKYFAPDADADFVALGGLWNKYIEKCIYNSWSVRNGVSTNEMQSDISLKILADMEICNSATHIAFDEEEGVSVSCGFISFENYFSGVAVRGDGRIECQLRLDDNCVPKNKKVTSDWICFSFADKLQNALVSYGKEVKAFNNVTLRFKEPPSGFCTWYYYLGSIDENSIYDNMKILDEIRDKVPIKVFQIDDGWSRGHFDEGKEDRFPKGMKYYADYIKEHNMIPGIWLTPFNFVTYDSFVVEHPECFIHSGDELKLVGGQALLDATHPLSKEYIKDLYHRLTYEWGYRYIKLDHVASFLSGGKFYDENASSIVNMRAYFEAMREGCHPDTYILACTSPMIELAGLVDGVRVSNDIFENWQSLFGVLRRDLNRFYINGVLFWNDPDCYMIRTSAEEDGKCNRPCSRTETENRTFATAIYTSGGALMFSDKLDLLNERQLDDYARFFPMNNTPGIPLDLQESIMPFMFDLGGKDGERTVSFINWSEKERKFSLALDGSYQITEHWDMTDFGTVDKEFTAILRPHESLLLHFKKIS